MTRATRRSPRGEEFEVLGRAGPVRWQRAPYVPAEAREELLVIKNEGIFLCARPDGDVHHARVSGEGLYADDTRYLSELRLELGGRSPVALSYSNVPGYRAVVEATNSTLRQGGEVVVPQQGLSIRRTLMIADRLYHQVEVESFHRLPVRTTLEVSLAADFADVFEVRGAPRRRRRGHALASKPNARGITLAYEGEDGRFRETLVEVDPGPAEVRVEDERCAVRWDLRLAPGESRSFLATVEPSLGGRRRRRLRPETAAGRLARAEEEWERSCTGIASDNALFDRFLETSARDLQALRTRVRGGRIVAAGIPWYVAPFGRDSLLASLEASLLNPDLARESLFALAGMQAKKDDPWRDAEPGKILHELRSGELAGAGIIPHTPYYGTVDATPLFLIVAAAYWRWSGDLEAIAALRPALDAALAWIRDHGDVDGDGFVEYRRRSKAGLRNHGWKDSEDSVMHADGTLAEGPIALVEVQAYVYRAKLDIAEVYEALGAGQVAAGLRSEAETLRAAFDEAFWDEGEGTFALALDGEKRPVRSVTSNAAHCLYCGIAEPRRARSVVERLLAADMFSGWGIRTLSALSPAFNPMSYHNGSVWPHDNAIAAAGFKRYGLHAESERVATALLEVAATARDFRLPELYCGFDRMEGRSVVAYPVACIPQAWAAAAPYMLLQAMLGIEPRASEGTLMVEKPALPSWLGSLELRGMRVGGAEVRIAFERKGEVTGFSVSEQQGPIRVMMSG